MKPSPAITRSRSIALATAAAVLVALAAQPVVARDSLGIWDGWGAFRDQQTPRCYAIAKALPSTMRRDNQPYATVGTWPKRGLRNQIHFRLSRNLAKDPRLSLTIGEKPFRLTGGGSDAWALDGRTNAAITSAMRSASSMTVSASSADGKRFSNTWRLRGAASAMDAAAIGCARVR